MKCNKCGSEWSVPEQIRKNIKTCPFCSAVIDSNENKSESIEDILVEWGRKEGLDFFRNAVKINGILADMFPDMGRERNAIKVGLEKGIGAKIVQLHYEDDESIRKIQIDQLERILLEDAWLSENATEFVLKTFISASDIVGGKERRGYTYTRVECSSVKNDNSGTNDKTIGSEEGVEKERQIKKEIRNEIHVNQEQIMLILDQGKLLEDAERLGEAISVYKEAVKLGDAEANYRIAEIFSRDEKNLNESIKWYTNAAKLGHSKAQNNLGYMYEHGEGVDKDFKMAIFWFQKAALSGNRNAQHNLAFFYFQGLGTARDYAKAFEWYTKAAAQGHPGAQNNLGILYEYGYGVKRNINEALKWYKVAAENDNADGQSNYDRCLRTMGTAGKTT